jgi:hypothetical protein
LRIGTIEGEAPDFVVGATSRACDAKVKSPRTVIIVPSVVSSAPQPIKPANTPLTAPIKEPHARLNPRTTQTGRPRMWKA